jgi:hypothetical protein
MTSKLQLSNPALERMRSGQPALGMTVRLGHSGGIVRIAKSTGHHFVFVDAHALNRLAEWTSGDEWQKIFSANPLVL